MASPSAVTSEPACTSGPITVPSAAKMRHKLSSPNLLLPRGRASLSPSRSGATNASFSVLLSHLAVSDVDITESVGLHDIKKRRNNFGKGVAAQHTANGT